MTPPNAPPAAEVGGHQSAVEEVMGGGKGHVPPTAAEREGAEPSDKYEDWTHHGLVVKVRLQNALIAELYAKLDVADAALLAARDEIKRLEREVVIGNENADGLAKILTGRNEELLTARQENEALADALKDILNEGDNGGQPALMRLLRAQAIARAALAAAHGEDR